MSSVSRSICRLLIVSLGLLSAQAAQAEMIAAQPWSQSQPGRAAVQARLAESGVEPAEAAALQLDPQAPVGGDLGTTAVVVILMFMAIFVLSLKPE